MFEFLLTFSEVILMYYWLCFTICLYHESHCASRKLITFFKACKLNSCTVNYCYICEPEKSSVGVKQLKIVARQIELLITTDPNRPKTYMILESILENAFRSAGSASPSLGDENTTTIGTWVEELKSAFEVLQPGKYLQYKCPFMSLEALHSIQNEDCDTRIQFYGQLLRARLRARIPGLARYLDSSATAKPRKNNSLFPQTSLPLSPRLRRVGYIYIIEDVQGITHGPSEADRDRGRVLKIGLTTRKSSTMRARELAHQCNFSAKIWYQSKLVPNVERVEHLVHECLKRRALNVKMPVCFCGKIHGEWFLISIERAERLVKYLCDWMVKYQPYDKNGEATLCEDPTDLCITVDEADPIRPDAKLILPSSVVDRYGLRNGGIVFEEVEDDVGRPSGCQIRALPASISYPRLPEEDASRSLSTNDAISETATLLPPTTTPSNTRPRLLSNTGGSLALKDADTISIPIEDVPSPPPMTDEPSPLARDVMTCPPTPSTPSVYPTQPGISHGDENFSQSTWNGFDDIDNATDDEYEQRETLAHKRSLPTQPLNRVLFQGVQKYTQTTLDRPILRKRANV